MSSTTLPSRGTQMNAIIDAATILDLATRKHIARLVSRAHKDNRSAGGKPVLLEDPHTKYLSVVLDNIDDDQVVKQIYHLVESRKEHLSRPVDC